MFYARFFRSSQVDICLNECCLSVFFGFRNIWLNVNLDAFLLMRIFSWMLLGCFFVYENIWLNII